MSDQVAAPAAAPPQTQAPPGKAPAGADPPTLTADFALALAQVAQAPPDEPAQTTRTATAEGEKAGSDSSAAAPKKTLDAALPDVLALAALVPAAPQETVAPTAAAPAAAAPAPAPASAPVAIASPVATAIPAAVPAVAAEEKPIVGAPAAPPAPVTAAAPAQTVRTGAPASVTPLQPVATQRTATPTACAAAARRAAGHPEGRAAARSATVHPDCRFRRPVRRFPSRTLRPLPLPPRRPPSCRRCMWPRRLPPLRPVLSRSRSRPRRTPRRRPSLRPRPRSRRRLPRHPSAPQVQQPQQPVPLADLARAAQTAIRVTAANGDASATIVLHPQELGTVAIRLHYASGGLTASVRADTPQAAQALQQAAPELRRALHDQGLTLLDLDVRDRGTNREPAQPRAKRGWPPPRHPESTRSIPFPSTSTSTQPGSRSPGAASTSSPDRPQGEP